MRTISIVASKPIKRKLGAEIIMLLLKTDYSHVSWILWSSNNTRPRYYESAMAGGVKFTGKHWFESRNKIVFRKDFEVSNETYSVFLEEAMDRCGEPYGFWQSVGIKIATVFGLKRNIFVNGSSQSNCSELIFSFKDLVGLELPDKDQDLIDPKDIVEACRKN